MDSAKRPIRKAQGTRGKQSLRLWLRLLACENLVEQTVRARLRGDFDITLPQFDVLSELEHAGKALTMSQLSQQLMVSNGNVTGVVDRLERDGYVQRTASASDRRVQFISLTSKGIAAFAAMARAHEQWVEALFDQLSSEEIKGLIAGLDRVKASLSAKHARQGARATGSGVHADK